MDDLRQRGYIGPDTTNLEFLERYTGSLTGITSLKHLQLLPEASLLFHNPNISFDDDRQQLYYYKHVVQDFPAPIIISSYDTGKSWFYILLQNGDLYYLWYNLMHAERIASNIIDLRSGDVTWVLGFDGTLYRLHEKELLSITSITTIFYTMFRDILVLDDNHTIQELVYSGKYYDTVTNTSTWETKPRKTLPPIGQYVLQENNILLLSDGHFKRYVYSGNILESFPDIDTLGPWTDIEGSTEDDIGDYTLTGTLDLNIMFRNGYLYIMKPAVNIIE